MLSIGHIICLETFPLTIANAHERKRRRSEEEADGTITVDKLDQENLQRALQAHVDDQLSRGKDVATAEKGSVEVQCTSTAEGKVFSFSYVPKLLSFVEAQGPFLANWSVEQLSQFKTSSGLTLPDASWSKLLQLCLPAHVIVKDTQTTHTVLTQSVSVPSAAGTAGSETAKLSLDADLFAYDRKSTTNASSLYHAPLLLIGVGGIGCEVLKILILSGFKNLHILDLDTIDATNLNRQFLFTTEDVGKSKAEAARRTVLSWFTQREATISAAPSIVSLHDNIKDSKYDDTFYKQFAVVLNALDNVSARQHVNFMCMKTGTPLIESGSMGFNGQVQPIVKHVSECYQCRPKPPDKQSFAVCTIHARPTTMVHCVHYAKELYESLFGDQQEELVGQTQNPQEHDAAPSAGSAPTELSYLRRVALHFHEQWRQRDKLDSNTKAEILYRFAVELLQHLFHHKIQELLDMKSAWSSAPPVPISIADIEAAATTEEAVAAKGSASPGICRAAFIQEMVSNKPTTPLTIKECIQLFVYTVAECAARPTKGFQKEDDDAVRFVAAVSNLRAHVYHLGMQPVEEIRTIAGAIVPAVATTNAMVAAGVVQQLYVMLRVRTCSDESTRQRAAHHLKMVYVRKAPQERREKVRNFFPFQQRTSEHAEHYKQRTIVVRSQIHTAPLPSPNPFCVVCQDLSPTVSVALPRSSVQTYTLRDLIDEVVVGQLDMEGPSVFLQDRIIFEEEDYEALASSTLLSFAGSMEGQQQKIATGQLPLIFVVDAINHEAEWRLEVSFTGDEATVVQGVADAKRTEIKAIQVKQLKENGGGAQSEAEHLSTAGSAPVPSRPTDEAVTIDIDEEDENVIEID